MPSNGGHVKSVGREGKEREGQEGGFFYLHGVYLCTCVTRALVNLRHLGPTPTQLDFPACELFLCLVGGMCLSKVFRAAGIKHYELCFVVSGWTSILTVDTHPPRPRSKRRKRALFNI